MTSPKDDERAQFEEFLNRRRISTACRADGDYVHGAARDWWVVWQASRTARAAVQGEPGSQAEGVRLIPVGWKLVPVEPDESMLVFVHRLAWINAVNAAPDHIADAGKKAEVHPSSVTSGKVRIYEDGMPS